MKFKKLGKAIAIGIFCIVIGASILPSLADTKIEKASDQSMNSSSVPLDIQMFDRSIPETNDYYFYEKQFVEEPSVDVSEVVNFLDDGTVSLSIEIKVCSVSLVDLYKEAFGISVYQNYVDMEVPINTTRVVERELNDEITLKEVVEPVRKKFYKGISEEQKNLFGFHITEFIGSQILSSSSDELTIYVDAVAMPYISNVVSDKSRTIYSLSSSPNNIVDEYLYSQMDISRAMLYSMSQANSFEKSWHVEILLPESSRSEFVENNVDLYEFEGGTWLKSSIDRKSSTIVNIDERLHVTDKQFTREDINVDQLFNIEYSVSSKSPVSYDQYDYNFEPSGYDVYDFGPWDNSWDLLSLHFEIEGEHGSVDCWLNVTIYLIIEGRVLLDVGATKMKAEATITAGVNASVYIAGTLEYTFSLDLGSFKSRNFDWNGCQPLVLVPIVTPTAEVKVEVGGVIYVWVNPEVTFDITAGGDLDFQWAWPPVKFKPIFEFEPGGTFDMGYDLDVYVKVRPALGCAFSVLVFGIVGPRINPELYLEAILGYSLSDGVYWHAELGFDLNVGLQFTPFLNWDWPDPIVHIILAEWDSETDPDAGNPADTDPPITSLHKRPLVNGFAGWDTNFWFEAKDDGAAASGLDSTFYNIPIQHGYNSWNPFAYDVSSLLVNYPEYDVRYYSVDVAGNNEPVNTETIYPDLDPPVSILTVGESPFRDGVEVYAGQTPIIIDAEDDHTGYQIIYCTWNETEGWDGWILAPRNESLTHYFSLDEQGTNFIYWFTMDGVGNLEAYQSEVFFVTTPPAILENVKMCESVGGPEVTEFDYEQECFCEIELNNAMEGETLTWVWVLDGKVRYVEETIITGTTCWNSWIPDLSGDWKVRILYDYSQIGFSSLFSVIEGPEASLEYNIMCDYIGGPSTTEFDYEQECFSYCEFENSKNDDIVKWMWIWNQDGLAKFIDQKTINDYTIWSSYTPLDSGDWHIDIFYNNEYVGTSPVFIVKEPVYPKGIIEDFTAYPNPVEYNGDFSASSSVKNIGEASGFFVIGLETSSHGVIMSDPIELSPGQITSFDHVFENVIVDLYCNVSLWWLSDYSFTKSGIIWESKDQILHDIDSIFIEVGSQNIIGEINFTASTFEFGPFHNEITGTTVALVNVKNVGIHTGEIHISLYEYADTPDGNCIFSWNVVLDADDEQMCRIWIDISDGPENGLWHMGLKVWGDTEAEPLWDAVDKTYQWDIEIFDLQEPEITTIEATNIKDTNMVLHSFLSEDGGAPCTCGFWYGTEYPLTEENCENETYKESVSTGQVIDEYIRELIPGLQYYVRAWAKNAEGFVLAYNTLSFHTITNDALKPYVMVNETYIIDQNRAILNGQVFYDGNEPSTCGFWYGTNLPLTEENSQSVTCSDYYVTGDSFSKTVNYNPSMTYYVCAWANNSNGFFISNATLYNNEFADYSYTFDYSNMNLDSEIPYTHTIEFPLSLFTSNSSIASNNNVEYFADKGNIYSDLDCVFHEDGSKDGWSSWKKWRYESGFDNSLTNLNPLTEYYFYINESELPVTIEFEHDILPIPYDVTFPRDIWVFNSSIKQNTSCENFFIQGGVWDVIDFIQSDDGYTWKKGSQSNTMTNVTYDKHYIMRLFDKSQISFTYDDRSYDSFSSSSSPYCGDANGDGIINVSDVVYIINYAFIPGVPAPDPLCIGDANGDGLVNISDAVWLINYVFIPGSFPPFDTCCE